MNGKGKKGRETLGGARTSFATALLPRPSFDAFSIPFPRFSPSEFLLGRREERICPSRKPSRETLHSFKSRTSNSLFPILTGRVKSLWTVVWKSVLCSTRYIGEVLKLPPVEIRVSPVIQKSHYYQRNFFFQYLANSYNLTSRCLSNEFLYFLNRCIYVQIFTWPIPAVQSRLSLVLNTEIRRYCYPSAKIRRQKFVVRHLWSPHAMRRNRCD